MHVYPDWATRERASARQDVTGSPVAQLTEILMQSGHISLACRLRRMRLTPCLCDICDTDAAWWPAKGTAPGPPR